MNRFDLTFENIATALFVIALLVGSFFLFTPRNGQPVTGFGPEWDCTHIPKGGGPICFKKSQPNSSDQK